jgi:N-terminal half of MaoC dehydratase
MWAGGALEFHAPIQVGEAVTRRSRVVDIAEKSGRSGALIFVTVQHEIATAAGLSISERQDIVYSEASTCSSAKVAAPIVKPADVIESVEGTTVLLFRYSALTFNGHRITAPRSGNLGSNAGTSAGDERTIELRIRISRRGSGSARCSGSRARVQPRNFFPHTPPSTIPSTSNAISPQPKRTACFALRR